MSRQLRAILIASLMVTAGTTLGTAAHAQEVFVTSSMGPVSGSGSPDRISQRSAKKYAEILKLDESQREVLDLLHQGYQDGVKSASDQHHEKMKRLSQEFQDSQDSAVWDEMPEISKTYREKLEGLEETFMNDLRALISDDQAQNWTKVERTRRREKGLGGSAVSGASVDVVSLVDGLKLDEAVRAQFAQDIEQYEADLDRLLAEKAKMEEEFAAKMDSGSGGQMAFDMAAMSEMMKPAREMGMKLRDLNLNYSRRFEQLIPEDLRGQWTDSFKEAAFPQVYRKSTPHRQASAALKFDDLSSDQREQLTQAMSSHTQELSALNDRLEKAVMEEEAKDDGGGMIAIGGQTMKISFGGDDENTETGKLRKEKRELDRRLSDRLSSVLSQEQRDRLPTFSEGAHGGGSFVTGGAAIMIREDR